VHVYGTVYRGPEFTSEGGVYNYSYIIKPPNAMHDACMGWHHTYLCTVELGSNSEEDCKREVAYSNSSTMTLQAKVQIHALC